MKVQQTVIGQLKKLLSFNPDPRSPLCRLGHMNCMINHLKYNYFSSQSKSVQNSAKAIKSESKNVALHMKEEISFLTKMLRLVNKLQLKYGLPAPPRQTSADNLIHPELSCIWENVLSFMNCLKENVATMSSPDQLTFKSRIRIRNIPILYYPSKSSNTWAQRRTYSKSGQLNQPLGQALKFNKSTSSTDTFKSGSVSSSTNTDESGSVRSSSYLENVRVCSILTR